MQKDNMDVKENRQDSTKTISDYSKYLTRIQNTFLKFLGHPYFNRLSIAIIYFAVFYNLLSIQFYPHHYIVFFCSAIFLQSFLNKSYAIILGLILTFPIYIYQNIQFALIYMACCASLFILCFTDWRIGIIILASFISAFKTHYSISVLLILLSGYLYGKRKGLLTGFYASLFITIFAIGWNYSSVGLFYFPQSIEPIFPQWKPSPNPFIISNILTTYRDEVGNISPLIYLLIDNFSLIIQLITASVGGYLAGDIQTWKIKYNDLLAMIIGSVPILFGLVLSELMIKNSFNTFTMLGVPFLFVIIITSISSLFWKPLLYSIGTQTLADLELPSDVKSELNALSEEREKLTNENYVLKQKLENYEKDSVQLRFIRRSLDMDNNSISVLNISTIRDSSQLEEEKILTVLKELEKAGIILIHNEKVIDKTGVRDKILEKLQKTNL